MLLIFSYYFNNADTDFTEIVKRIMNDYSIKNCIHVITIDNISINSIL